jgi:hypothetical protein
LPAPGIKKWNSVEIGYNMASFFNQYSFVVVSVLVWAILALVLLRDGTRSEDLLALGTLALGLYLAFKLLNPGRSDLTDTDAIAARIGAGTPVLIEFQSPY